MIDRVAEEHPEIIRDLIKHYLVNRKNTDLKQANDETFKLEIYDQFANDRVRLEDDMEKFMRDRLYEKLGMIQLI